MRSIPVPGLPDEYPAVHCGADRVCLVTVGEGHANAAASIAALAFSRWFDLRHTYWLIAGIAGINPERGTLGSAAWARYLIEWGLQWDAREEPPDGRDLLQTERDRQDRSALEGGRAGWR